MDRYARARIYRRFMLTGIVLAALLMLVYLLS
jgi:hypothetical protein